MVYCINMFVHLRELRIPNLTKIAFPVRQPENEPVVRILTTKCQRIHAVFPSRLSSNDLLACIRSAKWFTDTVKNKLRSIALLSRRSDCKDGRDPVERQDSNNESNLMQGRRGKGRKSMRTIGNMIRGALPHLLGPCILINVAESYD